MTMHETDLYIDVDGVLFGLYGGYSQLRPSVIPFLQWCTEHFACYWLTAWPKERLDTLLSCLMAPDALRAIPEVQRTYGPHGKAGDINYSRPFYWIEDGLLDNEIAYLEEHDLRDRWIEVSMHGAWEIERIWRHMRRKVGISSTGAYQWDEDILEARLGIGRIYRTAKESPDEGYYGHKEMLADENRLALLTEELQQLRHPKTPQG